jgi:3,4-dihydroxy 2-butanone 4-phosphate synthase/GTP cyclohydrolase II
MTIEISTVLKTKYGNFKVCYHKSARGVAISFSKGDLTKGAPIVRIHSSCLFGESFHSLECECGKQLTGALRLINKYGNGVIIYAYKEGRGVGIKNKMRLIKIARKHKLNSSEAFGKLGFNKTDYRKYDVEISVLNDLKVSKKIKALTKNSEKIKSMKDAGYEIVK